MLVGGVLLRCYVMEMGLGLGGGFRCGCGGWGWGMGMGMGSWVFWCVGELKCWTGTQALQ